MDFSSTKRLSQLQELFVARKYNGVMSPSSGGAITDEGDVVTRSFLFECKYKGSPMKPAKSISVKLADLEKINDEARSIGRTPVMALRLYNPDSVLSDKDGMVDLVVRLLKDDVNEYG